MLTEKEYPIVKHRFQRYSDNAVEVAAEYSSVSKNLERITKPAGLIATYVSRSSMARVLLETRDIARAERMMPDVAKVLEERVKGIFEGVDLSKPGNLRKGNIDFVVKDGEDERCATAVLNGNRVAQISLWKNPKVDNFDNAGSSILSLVGYIDGREVDLTYTDESKDYGEGGQTYEASLYARIHNENGLELIQTARSIRLIARKFGLIE